MKMPWAFSYERCEKPGRSYGIRVLQRNMGKVISNRYQRYTLCELPIKIIILVHFDTHICNSGYFFPSPYVAWYYAWHSQAASLLPGVKNQVRLH